MLGVYIHIPFCQRKCAYCAFSSFVSSKEEQERYVDSLIEEIKEFRKKKTEEKYRNIDTIYIGGGTPSLLSKNLLKRIIDCLKENFIWEKGLEFSIEANPCSLTEEKLAFYKQQGINRLSVGVQSLEDEKLKTIGRLHSSKQAIDCIEIASKYFENLNCDMLIGLPKMEEENFLSQIEYLSSSKVKHISAYMLQVEEGTPLYQIVKERPLFLPEDDDSVDVYEKMAKLLQENGFERYEVSNFAKKGYECKHNLKYWTGEEYIGFGLSAHSYINGVRFANSKKFDDYYNRKLALKENLENNQLIEEHIMLGLRCNKGIDKIYLRSLGYDLDKNDFLVEYLAKGIIKEGSTRNILTLNPDYYGVNNFIIVNLLP